MTPGRGGSPAGVELCLLAVSSVSLSRSHYSRLPREESKAGITRDLPREEIWIRLLFAAADQLIDEHFEFDFLDSHFGSSQRE